MVSFTYEQALEDGRDERHLLFDFGSTHWPKEGNRSYQAIADDIAERTKGQLDVLTITHRHTDHLSAFENEKAAASIASLKPSLVIRPWTENPDAAADAAGPELVGEESRQFAAGIGVAQEFADELHNTIKAAHKLDRRTVRGQTALLALEEVANKEAIERIDELADAASAGARYVHAGQDSGIEELVPGVRARIIGPPTVEQWPEVAGQREDDPEYWVSQRPRLERMLAFASERPGVRAVKAAAEETGLGPGAARWLVEQMRDQHAHSLLRIVRSLDDALNNTSVILVLEAGTRRLLFPGDAQIENWSYALTGEETEELRQGLDEVDLYKVGHHGSRNATPRSLVTMWEGSEQELVSMVSTMPGVHGSEEAETEVPRRSLAEALDRLGVLHRTDSLAPEDLYLEVTASTKDQQPFTRKEA